jgi:hypothetical protein
MGRDSAISEGEVKPMLRTLSEVAMSSTMSKMCQLSDAPVFIECIVCDVESPS